MMGGELDRKIMRGKGISRWEMELSLPLAFSSVGLLLPSALLAAMWRLPRAVARRARRVGAGRVDGVLCGGQCGWLCAAAWRGASQGVCGGRVSRASCSPRAASRGGEATAARPLNRTPPASLASETSRVTTYVTSGCRWVLTSMARSAPYGAGALRADTCVCRRSCPRSSDMCGWRPARPAATRFVAHVGAGEDGLSRRAREGRRLSQEATERRHLSFSQGRSCMCMC